MFVLTTNHVEIATTTQINETTKNSKFCFQFFEKEKRRNGNPVIKHLT